jgi:hypothetical protein
MSATISDGKAIADRVDKKGRRITSRIPPSVPSGHSRVCNGVNARPQARSARVDRTVRLEDWKDAVSLTQTNTGRED